MEKYSDFSWCLVAYGMNLVYHFVVLQMVAIVSMLTVHCHFCLLECHSLSFLYVYPLCL